MRGWHFHGSLWLDYEMFQFQSWTKPAATHKNSYRRATLWQLHFLLFSVFTWFITNLWFDNYDFTLPPTQLSICLHKPHRNNLQNQHLHFTISLTWNGCRCSQETGSPNGWRNMKMMWILSYSPSQTPRYQPSWTPICMNGLRKWSRQEIAWHITVGDMCHCGSGKKRIKPLFNQSINKIVLTNNTTSGLRFLQNN